MDCLRDIPSKEVRCMVSKFIWNFFFIVLINILVNLAL